MPPLIQRVKGPFHVVLMPHASSYHELAGNGLRRTEILVELLGDLRLVHDGVPHSDCEWKDVEVSAVDGEFDLASLSSVATGLVAAYSSERKLWLAATGQVADPEDASEVRLLDVGDEIHTYYYVLDELRWCVTRWQLFLEDASGTPLGPWEMSRPFDPAEPQGAQFVAPVQLSFRHPPLGLASGTFSG